MAGLCPGRETPSGTKGRARSGEIMLIFLHQSWRTPPKMKRERGALSRASRALRLSPFFYLLLIQPGRRPEGLEKRTRGAFDREKGRAKPQYLRGWRRGESSVAVGSISVNSGIRVEYICSFPVLPAWPLAPSPKSCMTLERPQHSVH